MTVVEVDGVRGLFSHQLLPLNDIIVKDDGVVQYEGSKFRLYDRNCRTDFGQPWQFDFYYYLSDFSMVWILAPKVAGSLKKCDAAGISH